MKMPLRVLSICAALSLGGGFCLPMEASESEPRNNKSLAAQISRLTESQKFFESARASNHLGKVSAAIQDYDKCLERMPNRLRAIGNRAELLIASGRIAEGKAEFERARRLAPADTRTIVMYAQALDNLGESTAALKLYTLGLTLCPGDHLLRCNRSELLGRMGEFAAAYRDACELVTRFPDDGIALSVKSAALLNMGRKEEALIEANRAVKMCPERAEVYGFRAKILTSMGRVKDALPDSLKAKELMPYLADSWSSLGNNYLLLKDRTRAIASFRKAISLNRNSGYSRMLYSLYWNHDPEFLHYLNLAEQADPASSSFVSFRALYHLQKFELFEAHKCAIMAQKLDRSNKDALWVEAQIYRLNHGAQTETPRNHYLAGYLADKARILLRMNYLEDAEYQFRQALGFECSSSVMLECGMVSLRLGNLRMAELLAEQAMFQDPSKAGVAMSLLSKVHFAQFNPLRAANDFIGAQCAILTYGVGKLSK